MTKAMFFVLGAADIEMSAIEAVLKTAIEEGRIAGYGYGLVEGKRVHAGNAYKATAVSVEIPEGASIVTVECQILGTSAVLSIVLSIDHHRPGDFGFGRPAKDSLEASSLGQVLNLLGIAPSGNQLAVAAADHNLAAAYVGEVEGVSAEDVFKVRLPELMARNRASEEEVRAGILLALDLLTQAPKIQIGASLVADVRGQVLRYAVESATMAGIAFIGRVDTRDEKKVFLSAKSATVAAFLANPPEGITNTYGDPARGFAGGTLS